MRDPLGKVSAVVSDAFPVFSLASLTSASASADLDEVARAIVEHGVACDAAVGWAARTARGWELGAGRASRRSGQLESRNSEPIFDLASVTKPMTAMAIARSPAIDRAMNLEALLEEARGTRSSHLSIELLLAHRAGLEAHVKLYAPLLDGHVIDRKSALAEAANSRRADALGFPAPREGFAPIYSDLGYLLAGEALARAMHARDAGEAIEELVVTPLGQREDLGTARSLRASGIDFDARVCPTEVVSWRGDGQVRGAVHDENAWAFTKDGGSGHAGMFGTIRGTLAFGCAALDAIARNEGPLASSSPHTATKEWLIRERPGGSLRAGFDGKSAGGSSAGDVCGPRTFGHLGFTGTSLWIDPDAETLVVVLTNRVYPTRDNIAIREARPKLHDALFTIAARHART